MKYTLYCNKLEGSHYEMGKKTGELFRARLGESPLFQRLANLRDNFLYQDQMRIFDDNSSSKKETIDHIEALLRLGHPELIDECHGLSEGLGELYENILLLCAASGVVRGCSHFVIGKLHAHNYDDTPSGQDNQLTILVPKDGYAHVGFVNHFISRLDGMNEKGLAVSLSFGGGSFFHKPGLNDTIFQRIILERATTVGDVVDILKEVHYTSPGILLINDKEGTTLIIEAVGDTYAIKKYERETVFKANHYTLPELIPCQHFHNPTTHWREKRFNETVATLTTKKEIMKLLTSDFPEGLFEPYYDDNLGTLWSVIFDSENLSVSISVGSEQRQELEFSLPEQIKNFSLPESISGEIKNVLLDERIHLSKTS